MRRADALGYSISSRRLVPASVTLATASKTALDHGGTGSRHCPRGESAAVFDRELRQSLLEISIADNGSGLPPLEEGSIFEPFVTTKPDGLGMGLAISRTIVDAHGGQIRATANPSAGATFTLPVKKSG